MPSDNPELSPTSTEEPTPKQKVRDLVYGLQKMPLYINWWEEVGYASSNVEHRERSKVEIISLVEKAKALLKEAPENVAGMEDIVFQAYQHLMICNRVLLCGQVIHYDMLPEGVVLDPDCRMYFMQSGLGKYTRFITVEVNVWTEKRKACVNFRYGNRDHYWKELPYPDNSTLLEGLQADNPSQLCDEFLTLIVDLCHLLIEYPRTQLSHRGDLYLANYIERSAPPTDEKYLPIYHEPHPYYSGYLIRETGKYLCEVLKIDADRYRKLLA